MAEEACYPEVAQLDPSIHCEEDVASFQVSVDDFSIVAVLDREAHLREPV